MGHVHFTWLASVTTSKSLVVVRHRTRWGQHVMKGSTEYQSNKI